MQTSKFKTKLQNSISASKLLFDNPFENVGYQNMKQLSYASSVVSIYHMESFYRDNTNDKYELCARRNIISQNTKHTNS
jgi:hypothetical protein